MDTQHLVSSTRNKTSMLLRVLRSKASRIQPMSRSFSSVDDTVLVVCRQGLYNDLMFCGPYMAIDTEDVAPLLFRVRLL